MISLNYFSFVMIADYLAHEKELQFKLGEYSNDFPKNDSEFIEPILMNLKTPYDVLCSTLYVSWASRKEDGKGYTFDSFCGFLIMAHEKFLDGDKLEINEYAHLLKDKDRQNYRERGQEHNYEKE